jgi:hypothetical protein
MAEEPRAGGAAAAPPPPKKPYATPRLTRWGSLNELTGGRRRKGTEPVIPSANKTRLGNG